MNHKDTKLVKIKGLIAELHGTHGNNWSLVARGVQEKGHFTGLDTRSLADKIRKAASRGSLSSLNLSRKENGDTGSDEPVETVTVNPYCCEENTKLRQLHGLISSSADDILEISGFNPQEFQLESCKFQFWNVFCKSKRGAHQISELFSASVTAAPRVAADT